MKRQFMIEVESTPDENGYQLEEGTIWWLIASLFARQEGQMYKPNNLISSLTVKEVK